MTFPFILLLWSIISSLDPTVTLQSLAPLPYLIMPLVVPGITSTGGGDNQQNEWMSKLMGKKLTDSASDHSVSRL